MKTIDYVAMIIFIVIGSVATAMFILHTQNEFQVAQVGGQANYTKLMNFFETEQYKNSQTQNIDNAIWSVTTPVEVSTGK